MIKKLKFGHHRAFNCTSRKPRDVVTVRVSGLAVNQVVLGSKSGIT
jgi:hypothetical protein